MARAIRPNHPGMPFHVTARLQGREPLFCAMEGEVTALIERYASAGRAQVLAYAVMPNHMHLLVVQGREPLARLMQPLMRRIALSVLRRHCREGHAFERRYFAIACTDPEYFRNAVAYIHLNPVRAGLCKDASEYAWTSHAIYSGCRIASSTRLEIAAMNALRVFAEVNDCSLDDSRVNYSCFLNWRLLADAHAEAGGLPTATGAPVRPLARGGDDSWLAQYGTAAATAPGAPSMRADLRDLVHSVLAQMEPGLPVEQLCSGGRTRQLVRVRRAVIARCLAAGHAPGRIARFLDVSTTTVSRSDPA